MRKLLLAEDHEMTAEIMQMHLRKYRFDAIIAPNGKEALKILEQGVGINAVVTDIMMPEMSGLDLLKEMRSHFEWMEIPVIVTSARAEPETVMKAAELGCAQFMVKPVRGADLVKAVTVAIADRPPTLRPREEVMEQLGIDHDSYDKFVDRMRDMLDKVVEKLDAGISEETAPCEEPLLGELSQAIEAAKLLGAESLGAVINRLEIKRGIDNGPTDYRDIAERRLILREFRILLSTIEPRPVAKEDAPSTPRRRAEKRSDAAPLRGQRMRASY